jgi:hypothetical protein
MYFIGQFQFVSDQQAPSESDRRNGSFSMMIEADTMDLALEAFRHRLTSFASSTSFFEGKCKIFITQLLEFDTFPASEAVIVNINSFAGDPIMPSIACVVPTEQSNACSIREWDSNHPTTEGRKDSIFMEFE